MVTVSDKVSRTLAEYRFIPRLTPEGIDKSSINLSTQLTKESRDGKKGIHLNLPVMSAAMQSVTGQDLAVALAQQGGIGVIFCSQPIDSEAMMVKAVKRARAGFVSRLEVIGPDATISEVDSLIIRTGYNTIPVVGGDKQNYGSLLGIVEGPIPPDVPRSVKVLEWMREFRQEPLEDIIRRIQNTADPTDIIEAVNDYVYYGDAGITLEDANSIMTDNGRKSIPIVNKDGSLKFMVFRKDAQAHKDFPQAVVDKNKRYLVGAAINTHDHTERVPALVEAGADVLFIDASDGFTEYQRKCVRFVKSNYPAVPVIAGNIISAEAFEYLAGFDIDGIKIGMGGGSICITQEQKGTGRGQATTTFEVAECRDRYFKNRGIYIPIIVDGGIVSSKDIAMALAFGADSVMMGKFFAGCHETPNQIVERDGKRYKEYWGEGSSRAKAWLEKRYGQTEFEEGVVSLVPYTGRVADNLEESLAKIRASMMSIGARDIKELQDKAFVEIISDASRIEGGVHDVIEIGSGK